MEEPLKSDTNSPMEADLKSTLDRLEKVLQRSESDPRPVIMMTCGIAGAGKSTLCKKVVATFPSFTRISIDTIIAERHGIYGVDYPADPTVHNTYREADEIYLSTFQQLLHDKKDIVLDRSFYAKKDRDEFIQMIEKGGGRKVLVYFQAERNVLWRRICERRAQGKSADAAFEISEELLDAYVNGFEAPKGEGEIVIHVK